MREVCLILAGDKIIRAYFGSQTKIPDTPERWEIIWEHRQEITEIAHSHPGNLLEFSPEDLTTMEAIEAGAGKEFTWSIVTQAGFRSRQGGRDIRRSGSPWWVGLLRHLSYACSGHGEGSNCAADFSPAAKGVVSPDPIGPHDEGLMADRSPIKQSD
jgi:hypothetical protein